VDWEGGAHFLGVRVGVVVWRLMGVDGACRAG